MRVTYSHDARRGILRAVIENAVMENSPGRAGPGGGAGLPGMRSRLAELGDGSCLEAGRRGEAFVVEAEVPTGDRR